MPEQDLATLTSRESNFAPDALPGGARSRLSMPAGWAGTGKSTGSGDLSPQRLSRVSGSLHLTFLVCEMGLTIGWTALGIIQGKTVGKCNGVCRFGHLSSHYTTPCF